MMALLWNIAVTIGWALVTWVVWVCGIRPLLPKRRALRARQRARLAREAARKQLVAACEQTYRKAMFESPHLMYRQDVLWIRWQVRLSNPEVEDPGPTPAILTPEEIESDVRMSEKLSSSSSIARLSQLSYYRILEARATR